jgi:hypothetical protein
MSPGDIQHVSNREDGDALIPASLILLRSAILIVSKLEVKKVKINLICMYINTYTDLVLL